MIKQNFISSIRRLLRHKSTTLLHILGLTLGLTVCALTTLFILHETSYDKYQPLANRTWRINHVWVNNGQKTYHYSTPFPLAAQIRKDVPGLSAVTQVHIPEFAKIETEGGNIFRQENVVMTDPAFLSIFDAHFLRGNSSNALRDPYEALLTKNTAIKMFGGIDVVGKTFRFNDSFLITVSGVIEDFPANTHIPAKMLLSLNSNERYLGTSTTAYGFVSGGSTFVVLPDEKDPSPALLHSLHGIYDRFANNQPNMPVRVEMDLQRLPDIHFHTKYAGGGNWVRAIDPVWLWFFGAIGFAVLFLACINFINLSTAQSISRAKEIGVRKTIGARRSQLVGQFLSESLLLVVAASLIALFISWLALPLLTQLTGKPLNQNVVNSPVVWLCICAGVILTALFAGIYPAWITSRFQPATALKAAVVKGQPAAGVLRKVLVIMQFSVSICLLIGVLVMGRQLRFLRHKNLGFDKANVMLIRLPHEISPDKRQLMRQEISRLTTVQAVALSSSPPSGGQGAHWGTVTGRTAHEEPKKPVTVLLTDADFPTLYDMQLLAGKLYTLADTSALSPAVPRDQRFPKVIVNEQLVRELELGTPQEALGKRFWIGINDWQPEIAGVVADFHTGSLHEQIRPTVMAVYPREAGLINIKLIAGIDPRQTIAGVSSIFTNISPKSVFEYQFFDETLDALYNNESKLMTLFTLFSAIALLISCLGLWGLITLMVNVRIKEIGVRKVLGASTAAIVSLLTRDFVILVGISICMAVPLSYWSLHKWLKDFAYRVDIGWFVFAVAGVTALAIAILTVALRSFRAAAASPVHSLKSE